MSRFTLGIVGRMATIAVLFCAMVAMQSSARAAVYDGDIFTFPQSDGSTLDLRGYGDEFFGYFETGSGYTVINDPASGGFCYAELSPDGAALVSTGVIVGQPAPLGLKKHVRLAEKAFRQIVDGRRAMMAGKMDCDRRWQAAKRAAAPQDGVYAEPPDHTTVGTYVGLTVMVDFSDDPAVMTKQQIDDFCNKDGYNDNGNNGSAYNYFYDNSNKKLSYTNVVVGYYRAKKTKSYYNDTSVSYPTRALELVKEVADYIVANPPADLSKVTTYANGNCHAINILYAGNAPPTWSTGLWPHRYATGPYSIGDGKNLYDYEITNMGTSLAIGTFCHENGHMICGYPDIYDYTSKSVGGAGMFCLMNSGGHGTNPVQVCAYLKYKSGWGSVTTVSGSKTGNSIYKAGTESGASPGNQFYLYQNPSAATEYYIIENRQASGRDAQLPASGIAVWHVDELGDRDNPSTAYNTAHQNYECTLMQADNLWHFEKNVNEGDSKDLFYQGNATTFDDSSAPSAKWWSGTASELSVTNISASGDTMTFDVGGSGPPPGTYSITGTVSGSVVSGVTIAVTGTASKTTTTGVAGTYTISGLANGSYTVTPSYSGATFTPVSASVTVAGANVSSVNFTSSGGSGGSFTVTSPAEGDEWNVGSTYSITWTSSGVTGDIVVGILKGGVAYAESSAVSNSGSFEWTISSDFEAGTDYQVKVSSNDVPTVYGLSGTFSIISQSYYATIGSAIDLPYTFSAKPKIYIYDSNDKPKAAKVVSWNADTVISWTAKVAESTYTLYSYLKSDGEQALTGSFNVQAPTLSKYSTPVLSGKNYLSTFWGVTGNKPKMWWTSGTGKKINCTVVNYGFDLDSNLEFVEVKFKASDFDKLAPTKISIKNSMGQHDYTISGSSSLSKAAKRKPPMFAPEKSSSIVRF